MPSLDEHQSNENTKILVIGDSGGGKTGALASLALDGYMLKIVDFDNGLDILKNEIKKSKPEALKNVEFETCTDKFTVRSGKAVPVTADAWSKGVAAIEKFYKGADGKGMGPKDVLVIDTMTFASQAALRYILKLEGRPNGPAQLQDWGAAQILIENMIAMVTGDDFETNVIVNSHVSYIGEAETERGYPATLGKALSPKIGRYFNGLLLCRTMGQGTMTKRKILTNTYFNIDLKSPAPGKVKPEYPIETGLADYFKAVRS